MTAMEQEQIDWEQLERKIDEAQYWSKKAAQAVAHLYRLGVLMSFPEDPTVLLGCSDLKLLWDQDERKRWLGFVKNAKKERYDKKEDAIVTYWQKEFIPVVKLEKTEENGETIWLTVWHHEIVNPGKLLMTLVDAYVRKHKDFSKCYQAFREALEHALSED